MKKIRFIIVVVLCFLLAACANTTDSKANIKVGYLSNMSGPSNFFGLDGLIGVQTRIDQYNSNPDSKYEFEILIYDLESNTDNLPKAFDYFKKEGIQFVLGAESSSIAVPASKLATEEDILLITLSASSGLLSNTDDMFFRLVTSSDYLSKAMARYVYKQEDNRSFCVLYDTSNKNFTASYYSSFKDEFEKLGGSISCVIKFDALQEVDYASLVNPIINKDSNGVLLITRGKDTGIITQKILQNTESKNIYSTDWAQNQDFIDFSGPYSQEVIFLGNNNLKKTSESFLQFKNTFEDMNDNELNLLHYLGYEATSLLIHGIEQSEQLDSKSVKKILSQLDVFSGSEDYYIDSYGDTIKTIWFHKYDGNEFEPIDSIEP